MRLGDRKQKLLTNSPKEVRNNKALFDEFVDIYVNEGVNENDKQRRRKQCHSCGFQNIFASWKAQQRVLDPIKTKAMSNNTFTLKDKKSIIQIPYTGEAITHRSSDEEVIGYLTQKGGDKEARIAKWFKEIPEAMRQKGSSKKAAPKPETKSEKKETPKAEAPKKPKKRAAKKK